MVNLNGMTLKELAKRMGISISYISEVFKSEKTLSEERYKQIIEIVPELKNNFVAQKKNKITYRYVEAIVIHGVGE